MQKKVLVRAPNVRLKEEKQENDSKTQRNVCHKLLFCLQFFAEKIWKFIKTNHSLSIVFHVKIQSIIRLFTVFE